MIVSGGSQIVQHLAQRQDPQLVRHIVAVELCIRHLARVADKLRRHVQLLQLFQRLIPNQYAFRAEHGGRVRHAVERGVMRQHQNVVRRHVKVKFKIIHLKLRIFRAAAERGQRLLREIARAAAVRRDRGLSSDERIGGLVLLPVFGVRPMEKLRSSKERDHNNDAEQDKKDPADGFLCFHGTFS